MATVRTWLAMARSPAHVSRWFDVNDFVFQKVGKFEPAPQPSTDPACSVWISLSTFDITERLKSSRTEAFNAKYHAVCQSKRFVVSHACSTTCAFWSVAIRVAGFQPNFHFWHDHLNGQRLQSASDPVCCVKFNQPRRYSALQWFLGNNLSPRPQERFLRTNLNFPA
jgi:hypothetical protein